MGGCSPRQARLHELFSKTDLQVVYTLGFVNPVGDFLSRWDYGANPAFGDVSIYLTAQVAGDVPVMIAAEKEELLPRPLVFRTVVARRPWLRGRLRAIHSLGLWLQLGGGGGRSERKTFENWSKLPR